MEKLLNQWLWSQEFWLPPTITWHDIDNGTTGGNHQPLPCDLLVALPLALGFIAVRFAFERSVVTGMEVFMQMHLGSETLIVKIKTTFFWKYNWNLTTVFVFLEDLEINTQYSHWISVQPTGDVFGYMCKCMWLIRIQSIYRSNEIGKCKCSPSITIH